MFKNLRKLNLLLAGLIVAYALFLNSCSDTNSTPAVNVESQTLITYLEGTGGDFINTTGSALEAATAVKQNITAEPANYFVMDIRDTATFAKGHIVGAVNVQFKEIYNYFKAHDMTKYKKVYLVCFSGQSAGYATGLLRLAGNSNVYSMKFGMASWHSDFSATWKNGVGNTAQAYLKQDSVAKPVAGDLPVLSTGKTLGKDILEARVAQLFIDGFPSVKAADLIGSLGDYFIMAYWTAADYKDPGHLQGAINYVPKSDFKLNTFLKTVPANKKCAIYCYTGHTASYITAFLKVMGYDVKSVSFGGNSLFYDAMVAKSKSAWKDTECQNYDLVK
ncbi:MAG: rhodanese-like domain-containing protein [Candidatus Kapabacteria bacterium]|nr:rhodanese-like domain-containing protein [Candidatus Kapabacteria bacterium]